ncbi:DoxX family protein [Streptomyces sp. Je 1-4]|uniref:DoxX family protein n=1 Tax=Streptomyces TaxID=1883 RepID=UPI00140EF85A|nr:MULTISPECIES: DoxX family protein [unclassified Streptomyces]QIK08973.1 DoxX family protein [Streptomyces sp. ID38640]UYB42666.1 DoxX family protein [Streptomyces sp. Je 1-4]UZQ38988.1 DoxX family protein [Streptomyces sp. Je 1-4] [Streptomyces sp. Je 1-4 4N24]UZQ46405.1 DoxX family protein [Streptomyces sp. Je 1-4] [Streptomyces sp. Je 1-4 4N24_ara]
MTSPLGTLASSRLAIPTRSAPSPRGYDAGLLLLRLALGLTMAAHGAQKLFGWFGGPGLDGTGQFFTMSGYPAGRTMAVVAGLTETLGGLGLAAGLLTPLAGAAVVGTMINALAVKWGGGFFAPKGVEYELLLTVGAAALTLTGPGRYAIDRLLPGLRAARPVHGLLALLLGVVMAAGVLLVRK